MSKDSISKISKSDNTKITGIIEHIHAFDNKHIGSYSKLLKRQIINVISRFDQSVSAAIAEKIKLKRKNSSHLDDDHETYEILKNVPKFMNDYYSKK